MMFNKEIFAKRVREVLKEKGRTQKDLAAAVFCETGTMSKYLTPSNKLLPRIDTLYGMSEFLGVSADWLIGKSDCKRASDLITTRDVCRIIMQLRSTPVVNFQETTITKCERCNDEHEGSETRDNKYHAYFFSDYFTPTEENPSLDDDNFCSVAGAINGFIKGYEFSTDAFNQGMYSGETYNMIIEDLLRRVPDVLLQPLQPNAAFSSACAPDESKNTGAV